MDRRFETPGDFSWTELMTTDVPAAEAFYSAVLGWTLKKTSSAGGSYTTIEAGGEQIGGITEMPDTVPAGTRPHWAPYVTVQDVDSAAEKARQNGGIVLVPPTDIPSLGRFCTLRDPQGAVFNAITYMHPSS